MKYYTLLFALLLGCTAIAPGEDRVVVNAQRTLSIAVTTADNFVLWEYDNHDKVSRDVQIAANTFRREFPPALRAARQALDTYKLLKSDSARSNLDGALMVLAAILDGAKTYYNP